MEMQFSPEYGKYIEEIKIKFQATYEIAGKARKLGKDPAQIVEITPAEDVASRVEGLVGPEGIAAHIRELISAGKSREEVVIIITDEILDGKWPAKTLVEAIDEREIKIEQAVRTGLALYTEGVVSAPLEGVTRLKIKKNIDNSEFLSVYFSGPIRGAGGTGQAFTLLLADYCRTKMEIAQYRPIDTEVERYVEETNLYAIKTRAGQYTPTEDEVRYIARNCAVCVDGEPTEEYEVSVNKNVPNVDSNRVRGGMVLVISEGLCLKAAKIMKIARKFQGVDWTWIEKLIKVAKTEATKLEIKPNDKYLKDTVAGRPTFAYPMREGGFTIRYGRTPFTGIAAKAIHPASMVILEEFPAIGTQVKTERPGKACVVTPCETIDGPIVRLCNGDVLRITSIEQAHQLRSEVEKIIFLGDLLCNYGDFAKANHPLVRSSWCNEWFAIELKARGIEKSTEQCTSLTFTEAIDLCKEGFPLAPRFTLYWHDLSLEELKELAEWIVQNANIEAETLQLPRDQAKKELLEKIGCAHQLREGKIVIERETALSLIVPLGLSNSLAGPLLIDKLNTAISADSGQSTLAVLHAASGLEIRHKAGTYIGASMGRPEKSKERKMEPPVHGLFPIGQAGGKLRSVVKAAKTARENKQNMLQVDVAIRMCPHCKTKTPLYNCTACSKTTILARQCTSCGAISVAENCPKCKVRTISHEQQMIDLAAVFEKAAKATQFREEEAKAVIGLISGRKVYEQLEKTLLRAKHGVYVFRDGTCRVDATEIPATHFTPRDIGVNIAKLRELGYVTDQSGAWLEKEDQVVELKAQDIIITEKEADYLVKVAKFVDDLLVYFYGLPAFYHAEKKEDLLGTLCICIAPHISAGITTRIIGFTQARALLAHPYVHCATRRNCLSAKTLINYTNDENIHSEEFEKMFEKYTATNGITRDRDMEIIELSQPVRTFGTDVLGRYKEKKVKKLIRRKYSGQMLRITGENGQEIEATPDHKLWVIGGERLMERKAQELKVGDTLAALAKIEDKPCQAEAINLIDEFANHPEVKNITIRTSREFCNKVKEKLGGWSSLKQELELTNQEASNWMHRGKYAIPLQTYIKIREKAPWACNEEHNFKIGFKRNFGEINAVIPMNEKFAEFLGLYVAEGWCWKSKVIGKESYHVGIAAQDKEVQEKAAALMKESLGVSVTRSNHSAVATNRILFEFISALCGKGAYGKKIPEIIFNSGQMQAMAFLSGAYQGDGHIGQGEIKYSTVSSKLAGQLYFLLTKLGFMPTLKKDENKQVKSSIVFEKYAAKGKLPPQITLHYISLYSDDARRLAKEMKLASKKQQKLEELALGASGRRLIRKKNDVRIARIKSITSFPYSGYVYDLEIDSNTEKIFAAGKGMLLAHNCDGDELSYMLLLDALLNFSREFLPSTRGGKMDAALVLSSILNPAEVDDEVHAMDVCAEYPLEFYNASQRNANAAEIRVDTVASRLGKPSQFEGLKYTHAAAMQGPVETAYVKPKNMYEKVEMELELMQKIRAVDVASATEKLILSHFFPDLYGNLRSFGRQIFRCVDCNAKFRRVPLRGKCAKCGGKILLTINRGGIEKYLELSKQLVDRFELPAYLKQRLLLVERDINSLFEDDKSKQFSLAGYL